MNRFCLKIVGDFFVNYATPASPSPRDSNAGSSDEQQNFGIEPVCVAHSVIKPMFVNLVDYFFVALFRSPNYN